MTISELKSYTASEFADLARLVHQLNDTLTLTEDALQRLLDDGNSHLYVAREDGRIMACACLCIYHQPFQTDGTIESVVVSEEFRGRHAGRALMEHILGQARQFAPIQLHLTSRPERIAANRLYLSLGFQPKETNVYTYQL